MTHRRDRGRPADRRARRPTATCCSTSPARPSTTSTLRERARRAWASRSPSTGSPTSRPATVARYETEAEVYERLGLAYIEPELREGNGEVARRREGRASRSWSSSATSAATCTATRRSRTGATRSRRWPGRRASRGYAYLAVTDHSASHGFGNHVTAEALARADRGGRRATTRARSARFTLLAGSEVNILPDGSLDYEPELLERARLGRRQRPHRLSDLARAEMTERVIAAIENPLVDCIGHLTGRLIGRREPYDDRRRGGRRRGRRAPDDSSRSTATPTAATSRRATPGSPPRPACGSSSTPTPTASTR